MNAEYDTLLPSHGHMWGEKTPDFMIVPMYIYVGEAALTHSLYHIQGHIHLSAHSLCISEPTPAFYF